MALFHNLDLIRVTEAAAIAASRWIGTGDKINADKSATDAMRRRLNEIEFTGLVVIGEGKKDKSYGLFAGEKVGKFSSSASGKPLVLAIDPIDGTRPTVTSGPEAMSVLAVAAPQALYTTNENYMLKLAYGPVAAQKHNLSVADSLPEIIQKLSEVTGKNRTKIVVCLLDRPRHKHFIEELRALQVRIKLISDCDISGAIATCLPDSGIDLLYGIGGAPEGVITACAMKCLKGGFQARLSHGDGSFPDKKLLNIDDMVKGECSFVATGITNGSLLRGVRFTEKGPVTNSVLMRSRSGTTRWVTAYHGN
jgi:fructose-1,6-bisphosphatase II